MLMFCRWANQASPCSSTRGIRFCDWFLRESVVLLIQCLSLEGSRAFTKWHAKLRYTTRTRKLSLLLSIHLQSESWGISSTTSGQKNPTSSCDVQQNFGSPGSDISYNSLKPFLRKYYNFCCTSNQNYIPLHHPLNSLWTRHKVLYLNMVVRISLYFLGPSRQLPTSRFDFIYSRHILGPVP
jgi:hypothetical protein